MQLSHLVKDWGGFEQLVAELNRTGEVSVEHNVVLPGRSGAPRQIDVLIRHKQGLYEHLIVAECKFWNKAVDRATVDSMATTVREVGASRGVIFSNNGFQSGAVTQAKADSIDLFLVRDLTNDEWGAPGKIIDFFLHVISISIGGFSTERTFSLPGSQPTSTRMDLRLGNAETNSSTPITWPGRSFKTLEEGIEHAAKDAAQKVYQPAAFSADGKFDATLRARVTVNLAPPKPIVAKINDGTIFIPSATLHIGISINQSRMIFDRAKNLAFALAVEDCVRNTVTAAARSVGEETTMLNQLNAPQHVSGNDKPLENGTIFSVWVAGFQNFDEFAGLNPGEVKIAPAAS
ncbi:restriction endonuclease [Paraburkholderia agricolaris]|uniref:restriction endonuclease n=1 Tax=Paraburkholderia agricolaris TaxID=2152888 RepID=UPI00142EE4E6|nr:restriction endonuclease [Paraburkholderia agricolaris]